MDKYTLRRIDSGVDGTFGELMHGDKVLCVTCEDPWNDNRPRESCISKGSYVCVPHSGAHFQNVWEITGVPHRSAILIHNGNTINDTLGCVLVGTAFGQVDGKKAVIGSRAALQMLRQTLPQSFELQII